MAGSKDNTVKYYIASVVTVLIDIDFKLNFRMETKEITVVKVINFSWAFNISLSTKCNLKGSLLKSRQNI
jgi:hypothetical protein